MSPLSARTQQAYQDLAEWLVQRHRTTGLKVLGINGSQGSGKSTLAAFLVEQLAAQHGLRAVAVSLDDFYLGRAVRAQLAAAVHPLLATRGVPGSHDALRGLQCLRQLKAGERCALPQFCKATDEALNALQDRLITEPADVILFEGWCVGTPPQDAAALLAPVNALERSEDGSGRWRQFVNQQLAGPYAQWFAELDALIYLQVPGWEQVRAWRAQQERETAARNGGRNVLSDAQVLDRFLQHYQRLTDYAQKVLPGRAAAVLRLNPDHDVVEARYA